VSDTTRCPGDVDLCLQRDQLKVCCSNQECGSPLIAKERGNDEDEQ
jgi:hypothetical protein